MRRSIYHNLLNFNVLDINLEINLLFFNNFFKFSLSNSQFSIPNSQLYNGIYSFAFFKLAYFMPMFN